MAVRSDRQGEGLGRMLLEGLLQLLGGEGVERVELHSRAWAVGFYERLGFERVGNSFQEVGLEHWKMEWGMGVERSPE